MPIVFVLMLVAAGNIAANESAKSHAIGVTVDFLPIVMSLSEGEVGGSLQTWYGYNHFRARLVGAHLHYNNRLLTNDAFEDQSMTVGAIIFDYVFGEHFSGAWIGSGYELWANRIVSKSSQKASHWNNHVLTLGGGYMS